MAFKQKLDKPLMVELGGEFGFVIATEMDLTLFANGIILMRGKAYDYENGEVILKGHKEVKYSIEEDSYYIVDEKGKALD